jgi:hypothetical protein
MGHGKLQWIFTFFGFIGFIGFIGCGWGLAEIDKNQYKSPGLY